VGAPVSRGWAAVGKTARRSSRTRDSGVLAMTWGGPRAGTARWADHRGGAEQPRLMTAMDCQWIRLTPSGGRAATVAPVLGRARSSSPCAPTSTNKMGDVVDLP
jgi:hypothetical protein